MRIKLLLLFSACLFTFFAQAQSDLNGPHSLLTIAESFEITNTVTLDISGSSNEAVQTTRSGLKWGAYNAGTLGNVDISSDGKLRFSAEAAVAGSYAYTTSTSRFVPAHDIVIVATSVPRDLKIRLLLCEQPQGHKLTYRWIISSQVSLSQGSNHFNVEDLWWEPVSTNESDLLDSLSNSDEFPINIPNEDGYGYIPIDKLRGGGLLISSGSGSAPVVIDSITWTRFCSECDDTQDNFQPLWQTGDLDGPTTVPYKKVPYVVSPTRVTGLYTGARESGTPVACYSSNIYTKPEAGPDYFIFNGTGQITYQVYVCDPDDYIVALCVDNPVAGTQVKISARPVSKPVENSFTVTLPQTHSGDSKNFQRLILDENTQGTLHLATGFNYITVAATKLGGRYMYLELIELVNLSAKPLVQAEAAEADSLRANMEWWYGKRGFMVANHRNKVMPRFGPMVPWKENARDWDITGFVRDVKTMGGQFVNFRALPYPFAGTVQAVEDLRPGATPLTWTETNRDFYMDLADALNAEGIKLTLLLGRGDFGGGDAECARQWMYQITKVLNGIGNHYGDKVAGYQFDGGHNNRKSYPRINCKPILVATKTGQVLEDRAAGANWSELTLTDPWQEFTLKEGYGPPDEVMKAPFWTYGDAMWEYGPGVWGIGKGLKSQGGPKLQRSGNAHMDTDSPISPLRNTDEVLFPWVRESLKNGGMITFGTEAYQTPYQGSYFSPDQINQMSRLTAYLQGDSAKTSNISYKGGDEQIQVMHSKGTGSFSLDLNKIKTGDSISVEVYDKEYKLVYVANEIASGESFRKEYNLPKLQNGVLFNIQVAVGQRKTITRIKL
ncbi:MAG TPA: hypothetical protein VMV77_01920 [Bacteroidales bacterium]|nr:hypothetical protein [Bacteroidales bacterium]